MRYRSAALQRALAYRLYPIEMRRRAIRRILIIIVLLWLSGAWVTYQRLEAALPDGSQRLRVALGLGVLGPWINLNMIPAQWRTPFLQWAPLIVSGSALLGCAALAYPRRSVRHLAALRAARHGLLQGRPAPAVLRKQLALTRPGIPLACCAGRVIGLPSNTDQGHIGVLAPTRSGKGLHLTQTLLQWPHGAVVVDPKGEQWERTAQWRAAHVGPVYQVPPHGLDLLDYFDVSQALDVQELHRHLLRTWQDKDPIFAEKSLALFQAAVAMGRATGAHPLRLLAHWTEQPPQDVLTQAQAHAGQAVRQFLDGDSPSKPNRFSLTAWGVFTSRVGPLVPHTPTWTHSDVPRDWAAQHATIYMCYPLEQLTAASGLLSALLAGLLRRQQNARRRSPTLVAIDELPAVGLHNLDTYLATVGGAGVTVLFYAQANTQLEQVYGPAGTRSILSNCHHQLFYPPRDPQTAQYISDLFGTTVEVQTGSGARGQLALREVVRPALDLADVLALPEDAVVALTTRAGRQYRFVGQRLDPRRVFPYLLAPPVHPLRDV